MIPGSGQRAVVFDLQSALTKVESGWAGPHRSFAMHVGKIVAAFFALLFAGLVLFKMVAVRFVCFYSWRLRWAAAAAGLHAARCWACCGGAVTCSLMQRAIRS